MATAACISISQVALEAQTRVAYDLDKAKEICDESPLDMVEGVWLYPEDKVSVMILADKDTQASSFGSYTISVVETEDARLHPGDIIGKIYTTPKKKEFKIELFTEKKNDLLLKPTSCIASLNKEGDSFILKKQKAPFKGRVNINFSRLLPGFWKILSLGISQNGSPSYATSAVGMLKIYPSYDGNGSSRTKIRYL